MKVSVLVSYSVYGALRGNAELKLLCGINAPSGRFSATAARIHSSKCKL